MMTQKRAAQQGGIARKQSKHIVPKARFRRDMLPAPVQYFRDQGIKLIGGGEWRTAICPFHADSRPSLRVNIVSGGFRCMACDAHGGDVLAFHRMRHGLGFVDAARQLGALEVRA